MIVQAGLDWMGRIGGPDFLAASRESLVLQMPVTFFFTSWADLI